MSKPSIWPLVLLATLAAPAVAGESPATGCFAPGVRPATVSPTGFAIPDLQAEKDAYQRFGWTWDPSAEPALPAEAAYSVQNPDIHGDTEGDDLWSYLVMHRRTGETGYLNRATAWARYFKEDYRACVGGQYASFCYDRDGFGADHLWGWGLIAWAVAQQDSAALAEAKEIGAVLEALWADGSSFGCLPNNGCTHYGLRQVGRHLLFATRLAEATGEARWAQIRDRILDKVLASDNWDATRGTYFLGDYSTDYSLGEGAYAAGARVQSPFMLGVLGEGFDHAYRVTGQQVLRDRMVAMARFVESYGLDPTYDYSGSLFGIVNGQVWHNYGAEQPVEFWDPVYTTSLVNTLMRGYRYTCEGHFLESAKHFFSRGNRGIYGEPVTTAAPEGTVHHFVDSVLASASGNFYLDYNKGELQYTYLLFEPADAASSVPAMGQAGRGFTAFLPFILVGAFTLFWLTFRSRRIAAARVAHPVCRGDHVHPATSDSPKLLKRASTRSGAGLLALAVALLPSFAASTAVADTPYDDLQPGIWRVISKNTIDDVQPCPTNDCSYSAVEGVSGAIDDWCGGALASGWSTLGGLVVWGGGHNGYFGSEVYVFDLATQLWVRASEPYDNGLGSVAADCNDQGVYPDGSACSAHTYDRVDYQPTTNRFFILSGTDDPVCGGCDDGVVHAFDFDTRAWSLGPEVPNRGALTGAISAYDASRDVFWFLQTYGAPPLRRYDPNANSGAGGWTEHGDVDEPIEIDGAAIVEPVHDLFLYVDARGTGKMFAFDLKNPNSTSVELTTTGATQIQSKDKLGFEWDPVQHRAVAWDDGADLFVLEAPAGDWKTGAWKWTRVTPAPANTVIPERGINGTYSRFRYVPSVNAFVLVSSTGGPVWMIRMNPDLGPGPNPVAGSRGVGASAILVLAVALFTCRGRRRQARNGRPG